MLKSVSEILRKTHCHTFKSPRLKYVLLSPPRVEYWNDKSLKYKIVRSKLKNQLDQIYDMISLENEFTDRH